MSLRWVLALVAGGIFTACCPQPGAPKPVAACRPGLVPSNHAELFACLEGVEFDTADEAGDEQPLTVISKGPGQPCPTDSSRTLSCKYGPLAKIEPVIGAHRYSDNELREGRFIARLSIPGSETQNYPKYGLKPGLKTYWWVKLGATAETDSSYFVTEQKSGEVTSVPRKLVREIYKEGAKIYRAVARWLWTLDDETAKGRCGQAGCT